MASLQDITYDCIIVGAGYSGLAAAKQLIEHESSLNILVLEARDRVGGRAKTIDLDNGRYWDVGGSFLGVGQSNMYGLAREYGVETFAIPSRGKLVLLHRGRARKYSGLIPPLRIWETIDAGLLLAKLEKLVRQIDVEAPWKHRKAKAWDKMTAEAWTRQNSWTDAARATMEMAFQAVFGKPSSEISLLHALFVFRTCGSVTACLNSDGGLQQDMMKGGAAVIANKIQQAIGGDSVVRLNEAVSSVDYNQDDPTCAVTATTTSAKYQAKRVIFAIPPNFAAKVQFNPPLPADKAILLEDIQLGAYSKVFATYQRPFWRDRGLRGECTNLEGFLTVIFDATLPDAGSEGKLMAFVVGSKAREFATKSDDERKRISLDEFASLLGQEALEPQDFFYHSMIHEDWSGGCPLASPPPGTWTARGDWIRKPVGPIHWAGTETSTRFYGYMDGAVEAGRRAAREVVEVLGHESSQSSQK